MVDYVNETASDQKWSPRLVRHGYIFKRRPTYSYSLGGSRGPISRYLH